MTSAISALFGVVVGGLLSIAKDWWLNDRKNNKYKEYLCIKISFKFDKFIHDSYAVVSDNGLFKGGYDSDGVRSPQVSLPKFEPELENLNWKSLPIDLMYAILDFPNQIESANYKINGVCEYESYPPEYKVGFEERQYQYALLGIKAFEIASLLRKEIKIPYIKYEWDIIGNMRDKIFEIEKLKKDRIEYGK